MEKCARLDDNRPFPIIGRNFDVVTREWSEPCTIPWWLAEEAYKYYISRFRESQSLEQVAARGGFGRQELLMLLRREA